jgi:hypothetical protein
MAVLVVALPWIIIDLLILTMIHEEEEETGGAGARTCDINVSET